MRVDQVQNRNEVCIRGIRLWHAMHCCYALYDQTVFEAITRANFCSLSNDGFEAIVFSATQFPFNQICNTRFIFVTRQISWVQIYIFSQIRLRPWRFLFSYWTNDYLKKWYDVYTGNLLDGAIQKFCEDHFFFFRAKGGRHDHCPNNYCIVGRGLMLVNAIWNELIRVKVQRSITQ